MENARTHRLVEGTSSFDCRPCRLLWAAYSCKRSQDIRLAADDASTQEGAGARVSRAKPFVQFSISCDVTQGSTAFAR